MDNKKIGLFIADLRKEKNMTQKDLADKLFVSDKAVSKWERGLSMPDISLIDKLSSILEVSVSDILKGEKLENMTKKNSDEIVKESIPFFQRKYFKNKITKIGIISAISIVVFYFFILCVGEATYGELRWRVFDGKYSMDLPSFSLIVAKNNSKKFLKALQNYDYDTIEKMIRPSEGRQWDTSKKWLEQEEYINVLKEIEKFEVRLVSYKNQSCYHNSYSYVCSYYLTFKHNGEKYDMTTDITNYRDAVSVNGIGMTYGNGQNKSLNEFKLGNSEIFLKFWSVFMDY